MQSIKRLGEWLRKNTHKTHYLFAFQDLRALCPELSDVAFKTLLSRAVRSGLLVRVCRGIYLFEEKQPLDGLLLFHVAVVLRSEGFNYISLETVLSDCGMLSQIPMGRIYIMSSGRSSIFKCGRFGSIEFVHTCRTPVGLMDRLIYDKNCGLWRANVALALEDIKHTRRSSDLIDWDTAHEFI